MKRYIFLLLLLFGALGCARVEEPTQADEAATIEEATTTEEAAPATIDPGIFPGQHITERRWRVGDGIGYSIPCYGEGSVFLSVVSDSAIVFSFVDENGRLEHAFPVHGRGMFKVAGPNCTGEINLFYIRNIDVANAFIDVIIPHEMIEPPPEYRYQDA